MKKNLPLLPMCLTRLCAALLFVSLQLWVPVALRAQVVPGDPGNFITTWEYASPVGTSNYQLVIPTIPGENYLYDVYWEVEGSGGLKGSVTGVTGDFTLSTSALSTRQTIRIEISGQFPRIGLERLGEVNPPESEFSSIPLKLLSVEQWGNIAWTSMERAFYKARYLQVNATDAPDLSGVTSLRQMFFGAESLNAPIGHWDVSKVTDMAGLFRDARAFDQDLSEWDVSKVTDMSTMFFWAEKFNQDIGNWQVSAVKDMSEMFGLARIFNQDIDGWNVSKVENMADMFFGSWAFNQFLGSWNVGKVSNMSRILDESALSRENYDATLVGWAAQSGLQNGVSLGATNLTFCDGAEARQKLIDLYGWTIKGDTPACESMLLFVKTEDGNTLIILAKGSDSVQQVKNKIQDKGGTQPDQQRLSFNGNELEDGRTLEDYSIQNGSTLNLSLRTAAVITPGVNNILYIDINVDTDASGYTGAGDSWANAIPQLADALKWARTTHDGGNPGWNATNPLRIFVAKGTYLPAYNSGDGAYTSDGGRQNAFVMVAEVKLYGGFDPSAGVEDLDDTRILPDVNSPGQGTVLSGDLMGNDHEEDFDGHIENVYHVTIAAGEVGVGSMDGFTITGGGASDDVGSDNLGVNGQPITQSAGGGMFIINSSPSIDNCLFLRNTANLGAGMDIIGAASAPSLTKCTFYDNLALESGGGITNWMAAPVLTECVFLENVASQVGGGMYNREATPSLTNCTFRGNSADGGGAMMNVVSVFSISMCNFSENTAQNGGGMMNTGGTLTLTGCQFSGNSVTADGGGLHNIQSTLSLSGCTFLQNSADSRGGAMRNDRSNVTLKNSRIFDNTAPQGGGIINESCPVVSLANCTFSGNSAAVAAPMMSGVCESVVLTNCTVSGNTASMTGGGLVSFQSLTSLANTIIWGNETNGNSTAPEVSLLIMGDKLPVISHSLVANWDGSDNWDDTRGVDGGGNIDTDPGFVSVTPGYAGYLLLAESSPARNAGSNDAYTNAGGDLANDKDLAGSPRRIGSSIDMGAYENQKATLSILYVDSGNGDDNNDGSTWAAAFKTLSHALSLANADTNIETILVAKGTYYPTGIPTGTNRESTFHIARGGIKLYGGYDAGTGERNLSANTAILSGAIGNSALRTDDSYHVMVIAGIPAEADSIVVDGFTLKDGYADGTANATFNGISIAQNYGGGIYAKQNNVGSKLTFANLIIQNNYARYAAGMFNDEQSSPMIINSAITGNAATNNGGGMLNRNSSSPLIINCTIAGNKAADGGGVFNNIDAAPSIHNTIVYGNSTGINSYGGSNPTVTYSLVQEQSGGTGNIDGSTNPRFIDPVVIGNAPNTSGDYRLQACSQAINSGDNTLLPDGLMQDAYGNARTVYTVVDIGAFEYQDALPEGSATLAHDMDQSTRTIDGVTDFLGSDEACRLIARVEPTGTNQVSGSVTAQVAIDPEVAFHNSSPYVQRHYLINAQTGESAKITLYFTQAEFDNFNDEMLTGLLPGNATGDKSSLRVYQYHGTSGNTPGDYQGSTLTVIDPQDEDIKWNDVRKRWEVSFGVNGFSGFFIGSAASPLPVKLVSFSGSVDSENSVTLNWKVVEQQDISTYKVQYSSNGVAFQDAGTIAATQMQEASYTFRHTPLQSKAIVYYRLLISEADGSQRYSRIISVKISDRSAPITYPVPADHGFWVKGQGVAGTTASLINTHGVLLKTLAFASDQQYVDIRSLQAGVYFVLFRDGTSLKVVKK